MDEILRIVMVVFIAITCFISNVQTTTLARTAHFTKDDLEIAVHDASLQLDTNQLAQGKIVIDPTKAKNTLISSIERNTGMTEQEFSIVDFVIYDNSNTSFPVTYESPNTKFTDTFYTPTVLAIIQTNSKNYFLGAEDHTFKQVASYSYKFQQ